jgi:hypothetical protein
MNKNKVFLIANNGLLWEEHIEKLNIDAENDTVVFFNYMYITYECLRDVKNKIVFLRMTYELNYDETTDDVDIRYLGGKQFLRRQNEFTKVILVDGYYNEFIPYINISYDILKLEEFYYEYSDDKSPTTGYLAYLYFKKMMGDDCDITLVGFTGHYPDGSVPHDTHHDYKWEQDYYNRNNVKRIYTTLDELQG